MAEVAQAATEAKSKSSVTKPEKPDEEAYRAGLAEKERLHTQKQDAFKALTEKLNLTKPGEGSPADTKRKELIAQLQDIKKQQAGNKEGRGAKLDKIKRLDEQLKSRINEQKTNKSKVPYKSVDEIDRRISELQKGVDTGRMKLVDEKKALADISTLNRTKKSFGAFDHAEEQISELKTQIADLRKELDNPQQKALSERYDGIQKELDQIKAEQDEVFKNLSSLRDQRTKLRNEQQEAWAALKAYKDEHFDKKRAYRDYENEAYRIRREKQKKERDEYEAGKRRGIAQQRLEEASAPAYEDEIQTATGLIRYFDPSAVPAKEAAAPSKYAASSQRTVNADAFKGMKVVKKDDNEDFMMLGGGKKKRGGKKAAPAESKFNLNIGVIEDLSKVKVESPSSQEDVPRVVEQLKEKIATWKKDQKSKTEENIAKAKKEIEKLEAEAAATNGEGSTDHAKKVSQKHSGMNGHTDAGAELEQEQDAVADAAKELKAAKIEDNE